MMNAVKESSKDVQAKVLGVVLFGYTKNKQTNSGIPGFPKNRVAVYCSKSDGVCKGTLSVTGGHFSYMGDGTYALEQLRADVGRVRSKGHCLPCRANKQWGRRKRWGRITRGWGWEAGWEAGWKAGWKAGWERLEREEAEAVVVLSVIATFVQQVLIRNKMKFRR
jgi:hypothetical protein